MLLHKNNLSKIAMMEFWSFILIAQGDKCPWQSDPSPPCGQGPWVKTVIISVSISYWLEEESGEQSSVVPVTTEASAGHKHQVVTDSKNVGDCRYEDSSTFQFRIF